MHVSHGGRLSPTAVQWPSKPLVVQGFFMAADSLYRTAMLVNWTAISYIHGPFCKE
jgi:hypothetical protein